jgi:hypothetical protein
MTPTRICFAMSLAVAACGGQTRDSVTVSGRLSAAGGQPLASGAAGVQVADGITLSRARIAVRSLRVENKSGDVQVKLSEGPLLIDASGDSLSGSLLQLATANVPAGTYDRLKIQVHRAEASAPASFDDLVKQDASVLLEGEIDGQAFTFASGLEAELEHEGAFTLGDAAASNITLDLDASQWFKAADGSRLDPRDASARAAIEANLRASFGAFEDDDHDGMEDRGDDHGHDAADAGDDHRGPGGDQDGGSGGPGSGDDQDGGHSGPGNGDGGGSDDPSGHH